MNEEPVNQSNLRQRFASREDDEDERGMEEVLIEKLDRFLSSIESRLDSFERYFKLKDKAPDDLKVNIDSTLGESRRNSNASVNSFKSLSLSLVNISTIHQRLRLIKDSVLKSSISNLENLYNMLDDQYNYLFNFNSVVEEDREEKVTNRELLSEKIITTIQYFDEKLNHVDKVISDRIPQATTNYESPAFKHMRFHNFNKALKTSEKGYLHYYQLPLSWRENRYIIYGYRFSLKHSDMLKSIFKFDHNESMNIWTHAIGVLILVYISVWQYPSTTVYQNNSMKDNIPVYVFLFAAIGCLVLSVIWHTYSCFAKLRVRSNCACMDYTGITLLITASIISAEYCSLYHHLSLLRTYIIFSSLCGTAGLMFNWSPFFDKPECRLVRIMFFVGLALLGVSTFFCQVYYEGFITSLRFFFPTLYKSFLWYWIGVLFYGGLFPEKWRYDVVINEDETCNHSHASKDIFQGVEHSGREEIEEIVCQIQNEGQGLKNESENSYKENDMYKEILEKHFPSWPIRTPYHKDFFSLWWVDYVFQSHNIWHICVLFGVIGYYYSILDMFIALQSKKTSF
ncbi:Piso0_000019 [Millerozyma farinosa CBS 7064]|uniref:Piso0_000019 protein n=1 Tax=Pichia sorbitophila (strain ATCC MYA-4447 / BCRC 22081 / CBS 7064 / NBRC 10061 / NRRL Y-12695) TaxID=559304 RepID=G8YSV9_PICSO|nr:Piso0_000019 [Millerozyma farinosa CBS 7064]